MSLFGLILLFMSLVFHEIQAGEIVLDSRARNKTQDVRSGQLPASAVPMDEGEVDFFPRHSDALDDKAHAMREGAKNRQSHGEASTDNELRNGTDLSDSAAVSRARAYLKSPRQTETLPVVSCDSVNNVTGRIGDDTQSGSIITVWLNGKQVQARCK